jgi:hypothetical protein
MALAPGGERRHGPGVRLSGVQIADIGGEEVEDAFGGGGIRRKDRRQTDC